MLAPPSEARPKPIPAGDGVSGIFTVKGLSATPENSARERLWEDTGETGRMGASGSGSPSCHCLIFCSASFNAAADGIKTPFLDALVNPIVGGGKLPVPSSGPSPERNADAEENKGSADALANKFAVGGSVVSGRGANQAE